MDLAVAPLKAHPKQGRFDPLLPGTPAGDYGRLDVAAYGPLPCALLVCEMKGPSATLIEADGTIGFRDTLHLGRCVDTDVARDVCLVGAAGYRTIRWLDRTGAQVHVWTVPAAHLGLIYGFRLCGGYLVVNLENAGDCAIVLFELDAAGVPLPGDGTVFAGYGGASAYARSMIIDEARDLLWVASMVLPVNAQGCEGSLRGYALADGALAHECFGHYPNDVDLLPDGSVVWLDEHLDRVRRLVPETGQVETIIAGTASRAAYEPGAGSMYANGRANSARDGNGLCAGAIEYRGHAGLYAPNGLAAITNDLFAIADTDNSRVVIMRRTATWEPEPVAVAGPFNEPTKVRLLRAAA